MSPKNIVLAAPLVLAVACWGCGSSGPEIARVEGKVTLDGEPLPNAAVVFIPENGRPAGARTNAEGKYVLNFTQGREGAIPGNNRIRITTQSEPGETADGQPIPASEEKVPVRYNTQTELNFVVEPGKTNVANFDLESGGPLAAPDTYN